MSRPASVNQLTPLVERRRDRGDLAAEDPRISAGWRRTRDDLDLCRVEFLDPLCTRQRCGSNVVLKG